MARDERLVAVTGATGRQGGAVLRHLLAGGWRVRALTRDPAGEAARSIGRSGAEVVRADMGDPDALRRAFAGAHGVYSVQNPMTSGVEAEVVQGRNVADAAAEAEVEHLVYGSAGVGVPGTGVGSWESKLAVEAHMRELGLPVTVLRPMAFMELMTDKGYYPAVSTWHVMPKLMGADRPVCWISVDDLGAIAALVFADPLRFVGAELPLAADVCTIDECRAIWADVTGRRPRRFPMPVRAFERITGTDLTTMWRWLRTEHFDMDTATARAILPTAMSVREWLLRRQSPRREPATA